MLLQPVSISLNLHRGISSVSSNFSPRETNYTLLISLHIRSPAQLRRSDGPRAQYKPQAREERERERERERSGGRDTNSSRDYLSCCTGFRKRGYGSRRRDISQSGIIIAQVASCGIGRSGKTCKLVPKLVFLFIP